MMRDKDRYSVSVRLPDNSIETIVESIKPWHDIFKKPFLRGIKALGENLKIGYKTLQWSAEKQEAKTDTEKKKSSSFWDYFTVVFSIVFAIGLFIVLPNLLIHFLGLIEDQEPLLFNLISGFVRLSVFFIYILSISMVKDVRRIFQYHGAEHKVIHAFEAGLELNYENIKKYPTLHKRCGTSFIFLLIFLGILFFAMMPPLLALVFSDFKDWSMLVKKIVIFGTHIIFLPVLASLSYEVLKISAKKNWIGKSLVFLAYPGLFFQKITTKEPDEGQVEVAIASLKALL